MAHVAGRRRGWADHAVRLNRESAVDRFVLGCAVVSFCRGFGMGLRRGPRANAYDISWRRASLILGNLLRMSWLGCQRSGTRVSLVRGAGRVSLRTTGPNVILTITPAKRGLTLAERGRTAGSSGWSCVAPAARHQRDANDCQKKTDGLHFDSPS